MFFPRKESEMKWIVVAGDINKGFYFVGPFDTAELAVEYATDAIGKYTKDVWQVVKLDNPKE